MSARQTYEIGCEVVGAKPTPTIEWTKGGIPLQNVRRTVSRSMSAVVTEDRKRETETETERRKTKNKECERVVRLPTGYMCGADVDQREFS